MNINIHDVYGLDSQPFQDGPPASGRTAALHVNRLHDVDHRLIQFHST